MVTNGHSLGTIVVSYSWKIRVFGGCFKVAPDTGNNLNY